MPAQPKILKGKNTLTLDKDQTKLAKQNLKRIKKANKKNALNFKYNLSNLVNHLLKNWNEENSK